MICPPKFVAGLLVLFAVVKHFSDARVERVGSRARNQDPLPDALHALIPRMDIPGVVVDGASGLPAVALAIVAYRTRKGAEIASDFAATCAIVFIVRAISINLTVLPSPTCNRGVKTRYEGLGGCYDLIFSGHSSIAIIAAFYLVSLGCTKLWLAYPLLVGALLLATRAHYSVDIFVAWCACITTLAVLRLRTPRHHSCLMPVDS